MLYQKDRGPIGTWSKNLACGAFYWTGLACGTFCSIKNLACGTFGFIKNLACSAFFLAIFFLNRDAFNLNFVILSTNSLVMKMIPTPTLSDHNDTICTNQ